MSRIRVKIGAALIALAAGTAGFAAISATTATAASASAPDCSDGFTLWNYYHDIGDTATATGLFSNLYGMGCFDDLPGLIS